MTLDPSALSRQRQITRVTVVGSIGNMALLAFKFVAGIVGHSAAMIADAVHSLSDFITDVIVVVFVKISSKPSDADHDYGHGKYETLATAVIAIMLFGVGAGIFWKGASEIWRWFHGETLEQPGMIALVAALISIVVKEVLYRYTIAAARRLKSKAVEANAWHHRSDAFSSIGTTLGIAGAIFFGVKGRVLDPLAAVVVSIFIARVAWKLFMPCLDELLERSLPADVEEQLLKLVGDIPGVDEPHNLRTRRIGSYAAVDLHVRMDGDMTVSRSHEITKTIEQAVRGLLGPHTYVSIHVEPSKPSA